MKNSNTPKLQHLLSRAARHPLITGSTILLAGGFIVNFLGYLFNLIMGRMLSVSDYGLLAALSSLLVLFGIFQSSFLGIFAKFSAKYSAREDSRGYSVFIKHGLKVVLLFASILLLITLVLSPLIAHFIKVDNLFFLFFIFLSVVVALVSSFPLGVLKGEMKFMTISLLSLIGPTLKIILGVAAVIFGLQLFGVTAGIFIAALIPTALALFIVLKNHKLGSSNEKSSPEFFREFKKYSLNFFLASVGLTIISNLDIVLVRSFFTPVAAGQYAALSLMGKAIFYLTAPVNTAFFPLIAQKTERNENVTKTLLFTIGLIACISVAVSFVYFLAPQLVLKIFFPAPEYEMLKSFLGPFSLYIVIFSIAFVFNNYFLSIGRAGVYKLNIAAAALFIVLISLFHASLYQVIGVLFAVSFFLLLSYLLYYYRIANGKN